ncbi:PHD-zinc-finger like domain-containing protein [Melampsora americana]|nr:PHD-zinc-finger like domain-containing protein [Melampsora americana]
MDCIMHLLHNRTTLNRETERLKFLTNNPSLPPLRVSPGIQVPSIRYQWLHLHHHRIHLYYLHRPLSVCVLCQKAEPTAQLAQCQSCTLTCHRECGGLESDTDLSQWLCLLCKTAGSKTLPKIPSCSLCIGHQPLISQDDPLSALDVWKLTEYNSFVHLLCAIWHHELVFSEPSTYEKVEGFASIPSSKRARDCEICGKHNIGACVKCDGCNKQVHVSCAWAAGYKLRFEMQPPKRKRNKELDFIRFKDEEGCLEPKIWCPAHAPGREKSTYALGDRDGVTNLTALQAYAGKFKTTAQAPSCGTLRKARRLDTVLTSVLLPKAPTESLGKGLDLEDEYMVAALGVLQKSTPAPATVIEPTPAAPSRQRKPSDHVAPESAPRVRTRAKPRARSRARSKTKVRVTAPARTDNTLVEPSQEFTNELGENKDDNDDDEDTDMQEDANHDNSVAASPRDFDIKSDAVNIIQHTSPVSAPRSAPRYSNHIAVPIPASTQSESMRLKGNVHGQRGSSRPIKTSSTESPHVSSSKGPSQHDLAVQNPPGNPADIRSSQVTSIKKAVNDYASGPSTAPATPPMPKPVNKLRLTIKPAASPPVPSKSPITEPEPPRHKAVPISSSTFPFVPTSNAPVFISHPPRPMSSASSSSSASLKPQVTRLPSINQLDSFLPSLPRLHHLAPLPTPPSMFLPTTSQSPGMNARVASPTPHTSISYQHSTPSTLPHLAFNLTPVPSMRASAPLLNPPSFDAFAAAAAAHTTTKSTGSSTSARTGTSVSPASSHKNIELNPPLLHNTVHLS